MFSVFADDFGLGNIIFVKLIADMAPLNFHIDVIMNKQREVEI